MERSRIAHRLPSEPHDIGQCPQELSQARPQLRPGPNAVVAVAVGIFSIYLLWQVTRFGGPTHTALIGDAFFIPMQSLAVYATITAAKRCRADPRRCWSWALLSVAMVGYLIGDLLQLYQEGIRHLPDTPDWSDAVFYLFFFAGIVGFGTGTRSRMRRWLFTLDTLTIALCAGSILWYVVAGPVATTQHHSVKEVAYAILFPLGDLILLIAVTRTLQRGVPPASRRSVRVIAFGIVLYVITDTVQGFIALHGGYRGGDRIDIVGMAAATCFAIAGASQPKVRQDEPKGSASERTGSATLSYAAVALLFALVFTIERHDPLFPNLSIVGAAVVAVLLLAIAHGLSRRAFLDEQTKNEVLLGELRYQAFHDSLTGLPNRALFSERLGHALDRRRSLSASHAVLMIDLDRFKAINDSFGHEAGDEVLRVVATRLLSAVRRGDTVARFGGDEFAILFEDVSGRGAATDLVKHLLGVVNKPLETADRQLVPEASVGIALTGEEPLTANELLRCADTAMYEAKQQGPGHYCMFDMAMQLAIADRVELQTDLVRAIGRGQLRVRYQPILELASQTPDGFEALLRWMHPTRGLLQPVEFLDLVEQSGLIHEIDTWVLNQACLEARGWQADPQFAQVGIHVNLSPLQLREPDLIESVSRALSAAGLEPKYLTIELLESGVVADLELARVRLTELKALGVRIAVDDFGTGYSSLNHLRSLPIDVLKIDRSFIAEMGTSPLVSTLVRSLIQLGNALGIDTIAEGIENEEQLSYLRSEACLHGQGFLFARPLDPHQIRSYLLQSVGALA